jgi:predicted ArsR family transcriptional regulator
MSGTGTALAGTRQPTRWIDVIADPVRLQILRTLSNVAEASASELATRSQASYQTLRRHLEALQTSGVIEAQPGRSDGETSGRPATRFSLAPGVRDEVRAAFGPS